MATDVRRTFLLDGRDKLDVNFDKLNEYAKCILDDRSLLLHSSVSEMTIGEFNGTHGLGDSSVEDERVSQELALAKRNGLFTALLCLESITVLEINNTNLDSYTEAGHVLSFHHLVNVEVLRISNTSLAKVPHSIGCMSKLRELDLSHNKKLTSLPDTIMHCTKLESIDVQYGSQLLPFSGWLRTLPKLKTLNRKGTATSLIDGIVGRPIVRKHTPRVPSKILKLLQHHALGAVVASSNNMSVLSHLPTNSRYLLESYMSSNGLRICAQCKKMFQKTTDYSEEVLVTHLKMFDETNVPLSYGTCGAECTSKIFQFCQELEQAEQERQDREYEEMVKKANEEFGYDNYRAGINSHFAKVYEQRDRDRRRRRHNGCIGCSIM